jgi:CRISPR-associated RAMP protein (TIGR02581 family)
MGFERLHGLVELTVEYTTRSALAIHAGKGAGFETVDQPVIMSAGEPIIPGSSIKGALRSTLESLLAGAGFEVCVPDAAVPNRWRGRRIRRREEREEYARAIGRKPACFADTPCHVCQIFGTTGGQQGLSGRALFLDARAQPGYELIERNHVAIARDTKSQAGGKLMSVQAVDAGATFRGVIRVINPEDWMTGALLRALEGVEFLGMGAKKTAGYGQVAVRVAEIRTLTPVPDGWQEQVVTVAPYQAAFTQMMEEQAG